MDWTSVFEIAVGVLAGGAINAYFARQGSQELRREAQGLKRQTELIMRGLEEATQEGMLEYRRNEHTGEIEGIVFKARAHIGSSSSVTARATVRKESDDPADQTQRMQGDE